MQEALAEEFPRAPEELNNFDQKYAYFVKLHYAYDRVIREIRLMETSGRKASAKVLKELNKKRLLLKDEIFAML